MRALSQASNLIDNDLQAWGAIVPLSSPYPGMISDCCNDWAAGLVTDEVTTPSQNNPQVIPTEGGGTRMNIFIVRAKSTLKQYIRTNFNTTGLVSSSPGVYP
jgi:hypothetical protein